MESPAERLRTIIDTIPALAWSARPNGSAEFFNRRWLDYTGISAEEASDWGWTVALHPEDRDRLEDYWRQLLASGEAGEIEGRLRRFDSEFRWFLFRASPLRDGSGKVVQWYGTNTDIEERKRAEDALRSSERSLGLIVDSIPGFVVTLNAAGEVELLNRQVLEYFGKTTEDLKNWSTSDAVHPDDLPRVIDGWRRSVETGQPHDLELRQRRADGVYRWFHSRALPARDPEGRITGWYMLLTDIDDRKKAEEDLRRSRAYLTEAQRLSRTGSFGCKFSSGEMFWSEETFGIFGYNRATKPAMEAILERVHPEDKARVHEHMHRAASEGKGCDLEYRLLMPDDSVKHVHVMAHASKDEPGRFEFVGAVMDVTAAKEAEERIRQDERELRIIVETIPAIVSSALPDGSIEFISQKWLDYVGRSREEIVGGAWRSTIHPEDLESVLNNWQAALATGEPFEMETRYQRADGKYRWFLVRAVPLRDDKGIIVKWYATVFDIEDRKRAEQKLRRSEAYLAEAQRLTHTGSWVQNVTTGERTHSSEEFCRLYGFDPEGCAVRQRISPEDSSGGFRQSRRNLQESSR